MKIAAFFGFFLSVLYSLYAQESEPMDSTKKLNLPELKYTTTDSAFSVKFNLRLMSDLTFETDEKLKGNLNELRFKMSGHAFSPKIEYAIQLSLAPDDFKTSETHKNLPILRDAYLAYSPTENWKIILGQTKLPGNRQYMNSSGELQLTSRSINSSAFNINRDIGLQLHYLNEKENRFSYHLKTAISLGEGINRIEFHPSGLAYTGRLELLPLGKFSKKGAFSEGDLARENTPKIMIGAAYSFNSNAFREKGESGKDLYETLDLHSFFADFLLKYRGFSFMTSYLNRKSNEAITYHPVETGKTRYALLGQGLDIQTSYLFDKNYELAGRFSQLWPDSKIRSLEPNRAQYTIGLTKYILKHQFKIQAETTYEAIHPRFESAESHWQFKLQLTFGL